MIQATFWIKYGKKIVAVIGLLFLALIILVTVMASMFQQQQSSMGTYGAGEVPEAVMRYKEPMQEELAKYGREDQINTLLAITTQESGGTASLDIMQASESLGLPPNTIQDPMTSIQVGVEYFDQVMTQAEEAGVDTNTAIQSYNMGGGYIDFVANNGGEHSVELAQQFSDQMKSQLGWSTYGDPNYIQHVKRYLGEPKSNSGTGNVGSSTAEGELQHPYQNQEGNYITSSEYGMRNGRLHAGIDLAPYGENIPVGASANGTVIYSQYHYSGGNMLIIRHDGLTANNGQTLHTAYMHLQNPPNFNVGETVNKGDIVGNTGNTGRSTGLHLHFEVHEGNQNQVNPRKYIEFPN